MSTEALWLKTEGLTRVEAAFVRAAIVGIRDVRTAILIDIAGLEVEARIAGLASVAKKAARGLSVVPTWY